MPSKFGRPTILPLRHRLPSATTARSPPSYYELICHQDATKHGCRSTVIAIDYLFEVSFDDLPCLAIR